MLSLLMKISSMYHLVDGHLQSLLPLIIINLIAEIYLFICLTWQMVKKVWLLFWEEGSLKYKKRIRDLASVLRGIITPKTGVITSEVNLTWLSLSNKLRISKTSTMINLVVFQKPLKHYRMMT